MADVVPHGEEHQGEAVGRLAAEPYPAVQPVAEALAPVLYIRPRGSRPREGHDPVYDADLAVVAVVEGPGQDGLEAVEGAAADRSFSILRS